VSAYQVRTQVGINRGLKTTAKRFSSTYRVLSTMPARTDWEENLRALWIKPVELNRCFPRGELTAFYGDCKEDWWLVMSRVLARKVWLKCRRARRRLSERKGLFWPGLE